MSAAGVAQRRKPIAPSGNTDWMDLIACRGSKVDFSSEDELDIAAAKRICLICPVRPQCLAHGQKKRLTGVYGGVRIAVGRVAS